jgi:hypothetical protein
VCINDAISQELAIAKALPNRARLLLNPPPSPSCFVQPRDQDPLLTIFPNGEPVLRIAGLVYSLHANIIAIASYTRLSHLT